MTKKKEKPIYMRIRRFWDINPKTRIKEDEPKVLDGCELCGYYKSDPEICQYCEDND